MSMQNEAGMTSQHVIFPFTIGFVPMPWTGRESGGVYAYLGEARVIKMLSRLPFAPTVAVLFGGVAAILIAATPSWRLEQLVNLAGIADHIGFARAPLGIKAQLVAALGGGVGAAALVFATLHLSAKLLGRSRRAVSVRHWADATPVAPAEDEAVHTPPPDNLIELASLPRFLRRETASEEAVAEANAVTPPQPSDELWLETPLSDASSSEKDGAASIGEAALSTAGAPVPSAPVKLAIVPETPHEAGAGAQVVYLPQPDSVLMNFPPPILPPDRRGEAPNRAADVTFHELIDRLERGLARHRHVQHQPAEEAALRDAIDQLDALMAASAR